MRPTKIQINLRMKTLCIIGYPQAAQWRFWSDCADAQADLNLRLAHMSDGTFYDAVVQLIVHFWM